MLSPKQFRGVVLMALPICASLLLTSAGRAQKIELQTCEDLKITEAHYGINTVETATCVNPTKTLKPKGTVSNVNLVATFPAVPTGAGMREVSERRGNLTEYFAKTTLTVK